MVWLYYDTAQEAQQAQDIDHTGGQNMVSARRTRAFFAKRGAQGSPEKALALLDTVSDRSTEEPGDAMPTRQARERRGSDAAKTVARDRRKDGTVAGTTTVRISSAARKSLQQLSKATGRSLTALLDEAIEELRRKSYFDEANRAFAALKANPKAWAEELRRTGRQGRDLT